jgi:mannose-1-phosphate guanylyltransferase
VKAVVLVGGAGTRLRPLTFTTPKPLLPIANIPFVERQLDWLAAYGVDETVLSLGYLPDAFTRHFADERHGDMKLRFVVEREPLGTAGGIRFAAEGINERLIVCNGDVLTDLDLSAFVAFHEARGAEATISLTQVDDPSAFGVVPTRADGEVIAFVEKPPRDQAPTNWINAGTYVLEPSALASIPPRLNVSIERETFPRMLERPGRLYAMRSGCYWLDIGTPGKYFDAQLDVIAGRVGPTPTPTAVETAPGVWVEPDAVVDGSAVLEAPVLVGARARVDAEVRLNRSVIGADAQIGARARLRDAVVLDGVSVAADADVTHAVLGVDDARLEIEGTA